MTVCAICARRDRRAALADRVLLWNYVGQGVGWTVMLPISLLTGLKNSLAYVVALSVWALALAGYAGAAGMLSARRVREEA